MKLTIHLTPKASHNIIEGWSEDAKGQTVLRVKVRAVPENGKANQALIQLLSQHFHIPQTRIVLSRAHLVEPFNPLGISYSIFA
jgi:uncharacterized protein YggU (UPF0235/DUF167 family)